jgi:tetratricopeptide (TPR) repeat protein
MRHLLRPLALFTLLAPAFADEIHLIDGKILAEVTVSAETLKVVEYKRDNKKEEVPSEQVLRVVFSVKPPTVESGDSAAAEANFVGAADELQAYIDGVIGKPQKRFPWAPAYAMYRLLEVNSLGGNPAGVVSAAKQLVEHEPDSRYAALAYLRMAKAYSDQGKGQEAQNALKNFEGVVQSKGLSSRWQLEIDLARILYDGSLDAATKRKRLESVSSAASGEHPTVMNRAEVAIGETLIDAKDYAGALKVFEVIAANPRADNFTLAAAYTGLGESIFQIASATNEKGRLEEALLALLRVGVLYPNELHYAPKAIFFAGLVSDLIGSEESKARAQTLYRSLRREYRDSQWAEQARGAITR